MPGERPENHHILFPRTLWVAQKDTKNLRQNKWLIAPLDHEIHAELHRSVGFVAPLDRHTASKVLTDFAPIPEDYTGSMRSLVESIEKALEHERVTDLEVSNAEVCIMGIARQIPYIAEGLIFE